MLGRLLDTRRNPRLRSAALLAAAALLSPVIAACGGSNTPTGTTVLNWYISPDSSGSTDKVAALCSQESKGRYRIAISVLPATADGQREQLVRRLAASDPDIDFMNVDPPYTTELANAGWLRPFSEAERGTLLKDVLEAPIRSAVWKGELVAVPYSANTQLLWYRKSVAAKAGVDPRSPTFTWDTMIDAALKAGKHIEEQGRRYEGYMVWINGLIESAGGSIIKDNDKGRDASVTIDSPEGREAARIINKLATSKAADPALTTADEGVGLAAFRGPSGGFMLNWPYVYAAYQSFVKDGSLDESVLRDIAWARYPRVKASVPSKPPVGGANLAISAFSKHQELSAEAIKCLITPDKLKVRFLGLGDPVANGAVYDDLEVRAKYPMADLMRESINAAGPRPVTPFYGDVSTAVQRTWHPPSSVSPDRQPSESATLIRDVLHDRRLL